jgi:hypothetical protein
LSCAEGLAFWQGCLVPNKGDDFVAWRMLVYVMVTTDNKQYWHTFADGFVNDELAGSASTSDDEELHDVDCWK